MASNPREWSVPAPVRALLWWPGASFVLVIVAPGTIEGTIVASGALLAVIGGFAAALADRLREHRATTQRESPAATVAAVAASPSGGRHTTGATTDARPAGHPEVDGPTAELPVVEMTPTAVPA